MRFWPDDVPQGPYLPHEEAERAAAMVAATFREVLAPDAPGLPVVGPASGSPSPGPGDPPRGGG